MTLCEDVFSRPFGKPAASLRPQANRLFRAQVKSFSVYGMTMTVSFYSLSIGTAIANRALSRAGGLVLSSPGTVAGATGAAAQNSRLAAGLYLASAVFNAMHFTFAPRDLALMEAVTDESRVEADKGKDNCTAMAD